MKTKLRSHFGDSVEEELDEGEKEEAGDQVGVLKGLAMDMRSQKKRGSDDRDQSHLRASYHLSGPKPGWHLQCQVGMFK